MNWRPENWENPYPHLANLAPAYMARYAYEAGANAMLAAVREEVGKVENPFDLSSEARWRMCFGFAECHRKILAILQPKQEAQ